MPITSSLHAFDAARSDGADCKRRRASPQERETEEEGEEDRGHPYGVRPRGNLLMSASGKNCRDAGLGVLRRLPDTLVQEVTSYIPASTLCLLSAASRSLYCFSHSDELWKALTLFGLRKDGKFFYRRCWKQTYLDTHWVTSGRQGQRVEHRPLRIPDFYSDELYCSYRDANTHIPRSWLSVQNVERVSAKSMSKEDFIQRFEKGNRPVVITDLATSWPAFKEWDWEKMEQKWGDKEFQCEAAKLTLAEYSEYCRGQTDDRPIYLFDKDFTTAVPEMASDFRVEEYFDDDMFKLLGNKRPDYRWLIMGPARSGSSFHVDPNSTDAWNACIRGKKRWLFYPPGIVPPGVVPSDDGADVASPISIVEWFLHYYHRKAERGVPPLEVTVEPGEVVYIPHGWWHTCLNVAPSICITQNYASRSGVPRVLAFLRDKPHCISGICSEEEKATVYDRFRQAVVEQFPEILKEAEEEREQRPTNTCWKACMSSAEGVTEPSTAGFSFDF